MTVLREIRQALAELELVSHAPVRNYEGRSAPSADDDVGGRRPSGSDSEFPAGEELEAFRESYQAKTVGYFRAELARRGAGDALLAEIRGVVEAWRKTPPQPTSVEPERDSFEWKCKIADDDSGTAEQRMSLYDISSATLYRYRAKYRGLIRREREERCAALERELGIE